MRLPPATHLESSISLMEEVLTQLVLSLKVEKSTLSRSLDLHPPPTDFASNIQNLPVYDAPSVWMLKMLRSSSKTQHSTVPSTKYSLVLWDLVVNDALPLRSFSFMKKSLINSLKNFPRLLIRSNLVYLGIKMHLFALCQNTTKLQLFKDTLMMLLLKEPKFVIATVDWYLKLSTSLLSFTQSPIR